MKTNSLNKLTTVEKFAKWAINLSAEDIPDKVFDIARVQKKSVVGSISAACKSDAAIRILKSIAKSAHDGPVPLIGSGKLVTVEDAIFGACVMSMSLDFDDYICFGHSSHSSVIVPMFLAAETGSDGTEQLIAQIISNELEGRLGGACLLGSQNGQLWSFIHCIGAAVTSSRLLKLDEVQTANAIAIALYQPPKALVPGFMAPDSKLLTAAEPCLVGLRAARLAKDNVTGPLDILDSNDGFFSAFSWQPLCGFLEDLGNVWLTLTLSVKPYPGCAYLDTTIDSMLSIVSDEDFKENVASDIDNIKKISVEANLLTIGMNLLSKRYSDIVNTNITAVTINFSIAVNIAIILLAGELTPVQLTDEWLDKHRDEILKIVKKIEIKHDYGLTKDTIDSFGKIIKTDQILQNLTPMTVLRIVLELNNQKSSFQNILGDPFQALYRILSFMAVRNRTLVRFLRDPIYRLRFIARLVVNRSYPIGKSTRKENSKICLWKTKNLNSFEISFPARITISTNKRRYSELTFNPKGGCGNLEFPPSKIAEKRLNECGIYLFDNKFVKDLHGLIDNDDDNLVHTLGAKAKTVI